MKVNSSLVAKIVWIGVGSFDGLDLHNLEIDGLGGGTLSLTDALNGAD